MAAADARAPDSEAQRYALRHPPPRAHDTDPLPRLLPRSDVAAYALMVKEAHAHAQLALEGLRAAVVAAPEPLRRNTIFVQNELEEVQDVFRSLLTQAARAAAGGGHGVRAGRSNEKK